MGLAELAQRNCDQCRLWSALLELTYRCNLDCVICYNDLGQRGEPLSLDQYKELLDGLDELQTSSLTLSGGEPTAHPLFLQIGAYANQLGFVIGIKSNGHSLRGKMIPRIKEQIDPYRIEISLHGAKAATHDRQTRVPGSFDRLLENLRSLTANGIRVKLKAPLTRWNAGEVPGMFDLADELGVPLSVFSNLSPRDNGDRAPLALSATPAQRQQARSYMRQRIAKRTDKNDGARHDELRGRHQ